MYKIHILFKGETNPVTETSSCLPLIEGQFVRIITEGDFLEINKAVYSRQDFISSMYIEKEKNA
jgi:hypothetical protein